MVLPVGDLCGDDAVGVVFVAEDFTLPQCVVAVLDREWRPLWWCSFAAGGVGGRQVVDEGCEGGAVADDVVGEEEDEVVVGAQGEDPGA